MFKGWGGFLWGLLLLPLTLATLKGLPSVLWSWSGDLEGLLPIAAGVVIYAAFEAVFSRPMRTYVFGHELTHALASILMGGTVHEFKVAKDGGHVKLSKSNFFVALAPYCIPIYTLFVLAGYYLLGFWYPVETYRWGLLAMVGFTLAFHASLTLFAIRQEQPDIKQTGAFFSLVFIVLVNAWFLVLLSKLLFWNLFSLKSFAWTALKTQTDIWIWTFRQIWEGARRAMDYASVRARS